MFILIVEAKQAIARIVTLAAIGTRNEAAEVHSLPIVIFGDGKAGAATAGNEKHARVLCGCFHRLRCVRFHRRQNSRIPIIAAQTNDTQVSTSQTIAGIEPNDLRTMPHIHAASAANTEPSSISKQTVSTLPA
jgi:hypothetical protein